MAKMRRTAAMLAAALSWTTAVTADAATVPDCVPTYAIECSTGWGSMIRLVEAFSIIFEEPCVTHDLCYRHGEATYGYDKAKCDEDFLAAMDERCRDPELRFIDVATVGLSRVTCHAAKRAFYAAVSRSKIAEDAFKACTESRYCRYE